jgi:hypothetical protein
MFTNVVNTIYIIIYQYGTYGRETTIKLNHNKICLVMDV